MENEYWIYEKCEPIIKELKMKGFTYAQIGKEIRKTYPSMTDSTVSKLGLKLLGSMQDYRKNDDGTLTKSRYRIPIDDEVMGLLEKARERLRVDLGRKYLPTYAETIKDLINKC